MCVTCSVRLIYLRGWLLCSVCVWEEFVRGGEGDEGDIEKLWVA